MNSRCSRVYREKIEYRVDCIDAAIAHQLPSKPFICLVHCDFQNTPIPKLIQLAEKLVNTQAMWVAAHGPNCSLFDDLVDETVVADEVLKNITRPHIITTWHEEESLEEAIEELGLIGLVSDEWQVDDYDLVVLTINA